MKPVIILGKEYNNKEEIRTALKELSKDVGLLNFNAGYQFTKKDAGPSDSLGATILRNVQESIGSGVYTTPDIVDVEEWRKHRTKEQGLKETDFSINIIDLSKYQNGMIKVANDDESKIMTDFLRDLTRSILSSKDLSEKVIAFRQKEKGNNSTPKYLSQYVSPDKLMTKNDKFFSLFCSDISKNALENWINKNTQKVSTLLDNELINNKKTSVFKEDGIATDFFKTFCHATGIDNSRTQFSDSTSLGNLIFDIDKVKPLADVGNNITCAYYLFRLNYKKIFEQKAKAIMESEDDCDLIQFANTYEPCFRGHKTAEEIKKDIKHLYKKQQEEALDKRAEEIVKSKLIPDKNALKHTRLSSFKRK